MKNAGFLLIFFLINSGVFAQDCDCIISQVEANTVVPCDYSIGEEIIVSTASEFIDAVNLVNNQEGNMTILIEDGTYQIASTAWYPYITASNVVFRSLSGNRDAVILTGEGMNDVNPDTEIGIYAIGDNITIANLTIKEVGNHGIAVTGDNLFVYNVKIQDTYEQMIKGNNTEDGILNGIVKCSLFEYTNGIGPQWYIGGLDIHGGIDWIVSDNVFNDIASPSVAVAEHAVHFWDSSSGNVVERNKIHNCDRGIGFGLGSSTNQAGIIKNNIIFNDGLNVFDDVGIGLESSPDTKVYNNTIYIEYPNGIEYRFESTQNVELINNICNGQIKSRDNGIANKTNNVVDVTPSWFVDVSVGDLTINPLGAATVGGQPVDGVVIDIFKTIRNPMNDFQYGAEEISSGGGGLGFDKIQNQSVDVYPNPVSDYFRLSSNDPQLYQLDIFNSIGQEMMSMEKVSMYPSLDINPVNWENGMYYCRLYNDKQASQTIKILLLSK